jgi:type I restriction enzyme, S subunit
MTMPTKNKKQNLLPELRFHEFRHERPWQLVPLGNHADIIKERAGKKKYPVMSVETGVGLISQMEKFGRDISGNSYKNYTVIQRDDFAYNKSATKEFPEGFIAKHKADNQAAVPNSIFTCFRITSGEIQSDYLYFQLLNNLHGKWLRKFITVGARAHGALSVNADDLLALPVPLPIGESSIAEQQKIADCLGSLDELLAAHRRKLAALQDHKKGLLQQLFPAEGETTPNLRFPGFEGEWDPLSVEELLKGLPTRDHQILSSEIKEMGKYPVVDQGQSAIAGYSDRSEKLFHKHPVIVFGDHTTVVKFIDFDFIVGADGTKLLTKRRKPDSLQFLSFALANYKMAQEGYKRHFTILRQIVIPIPSPPEQQKIADCLSALDALITAQTDQIAALQAHKKGLMQQLFPNPQGVA